MTISTFKKAVAAAALAIGFAGAADADIIDFSYGGNTVATLTTSGGTSFVLDFISAPDGGDAFINDLFLVGPGGTFSAAAGQDTFAVASYDSTGLGDGNAFNWMLDFPQANNASRFTVGESFAWSIGGTDPDSWDTSLLHINAFLNGNSIKLDGCVRGTDRCTPVPEPATLALLGIGLVGAGIARRRRK